MPYPTEDVTAILGLSIETVDQVQAQMLTLNSTLDKSTPDLTKDPVLLASRVVSHFFNYVSSFVDASGTMAPNVMVPVSIINKWYDIFLHKVKAGGVGFLERNE